MWVDFPGHYQFCVNHNKTYCLFYVKCGIFRTAISTMWHRRQGNPLPLQRVKVSHEISTIVRLFRIDSAVESQRFLGSSLNFPVICCSVRLWGFLKTIPFMCRFFLKFVFKHWRKNNLKWPRFNSRSKLYPYSFSP